MRQLFRAPKILAEVEDEHGLIRVVERGLYRFLEFGQTQAEQSRVLTADPAWLEYDYARAMLLAALLHPQPESALFLGLGAGTVTHACLKALPDLFDVEVIELRAEVLRLAEQYLGFPQDERLTIRIGDAHRLLSSAERSDLIFVDLYLEEGPDQGHLQWGFLRHCYDLLEPGGWLIINQWATWEGKPLGAPILRGVFGRNYWEIPVTDGNVIVLVPQHDSAQLDLATLRNRAMQVTAQLGFDLRYLINKIRSAS